MAKFNSAAFGNQMSAQIGSSTPAYGYGAREYGGPTAKGREAHVQVKEQNSGMMPAEDYSVATFAPSLWLDIEREGAPVTMQGGTIVGVAGVLSEDGLNEMTLVHQVVAANAGVPQKLTYTKDDKGITLDIDTLSLTSESAGARVGKTGDTTNMVAGNKPLAYTPTHVIGTALNQVHTNMQFDEPNTMKTQWLVMYPVDDLFMFGGTIAENSGSRVLASVTAGVFVTGETVTGDTSGATFVIGEFGTNKDGSVNDGILENGFIAKSGVLLGPLTDGETLTGGTSGATAEFIEELNSDGHDARVEVDDQTVGYSRVSLGFASAYLSNNATAGESLDLEGILIGDKVMPNPYLPGKLISVADFVRCAMYDVEGNISHDGTNPIGLREVIANWATDLGETTLKAAVTLAQAYAYASEHVVGTCFKRQSRADFTEGQFVNKDISTEIMSFLGQVPELGLQGTASDGIEADQESARQLALSGLANSIDVVFINYNIK